MKRSRSDSLPLPIPSYDPQVLDLLPVAVYVCDQGGTIRYFNRRASELWGRSPRCGDPEERYCGSCSLYYPDGRPMPHDSSPMAEALRTGQPQRNAEALVQRLDGSRVPVLVNIDPLRDHEGRLTGAISVLQDISDRKQFEQQLQRSEQALLEKEQHLRLVTDHASISIAHCDREWRYRFVNLPYARRFGLTPDDVVGRRIPEVVGEQAFASFRHHVERALAGERVEFETEVPYEQIGRQVVHCIYVPEFGQDGEVKGLIAAITDVTDRARAERAMQASEERFRSLSACSPLGIFMTDNEGRCSYINRRCQEICGFTPEQALGEGWARFVVEEDRQTALRQWTSQVTSGREYSGELRFQDPKGPVRWCHVRSSPMLDDSGRIIGHVGTVEDITDRRAAEAALRESEAKFRELAENFHDVVWLGIPQQQQVLFVSPSYEEIWGRRREDLYHDFQQWIEGIHPDDRPRVAASFAENVLEGTYDEEYRVLRPDGSVRWIRDRGFPIHEPSGEVLRVVGAAEDITDRRETEQRLEAVLGSISDHLVTYDRQWRYSYLTDKAAEILGRSKEELLGRCIWEVFPDAVGNQYYRELHQALDEQRVIRSEHYYAPFDRWFENHIYPSPNGVTVFSADVTWRKKLEVEVQRRVEELALADRRKDEFLAMLAHELRNPLAPIRSGLSLLALEHGSSEPIQLMQEQVDHLVRLVDDLLDVSRIVRGKIELRREPTDVAKLIKRAVQTVHSALVERQHRLTVSLPQEPVVVDIDPVRMAQVVTNLLNNSIKYTDPGGQISLEAERERDGILLRVRDNGVGIEPELLPHVFDLFTQSERSIDRSQGGLGLGLTLVKSLVEMHDGTVAVRSAGYQQGCEFSIFLPVLPGSAQVPQREQQDKVAQGRRILVVDDNVGAAKMLGLLLSRCGADAVHLAHDGPGALEAARQHQPEIILLDIGLPRMDGYEVARQLRAHTDFHQTLLVAVTGYGQDEDLQRSHDAGFDEHLVKPPTMEALVGLFDHPKLL